MWELILLELRNTSKLIFLIKIGRPMNRSITFGKKINRQSTQHIIDGKPLFILNRSSKRFPSHSQEYNSKNVKNVNTK